ncbi:uncharacterized protein L203_102007 [Cryptococcus depauperatus CBS 7841]|uniref:Cytochrome P450 n=1 Tax=Cryptococcus depauperatus CBS 7841 TaxID=1295531 RepID=A0AAJ8M0A4_9TREE
MTVLQIISKAASILRTGFAKLQWVDIYAVISIGIAAVILQWLYIYVQVRRQVRGLSTVHSLIEVFESGSRSQLPHIPFVCPINDFTINDPWKKYADRRTDLIACTQMTTPYAVYVTSSSSTSQIISAKSSVFVKPTEMFRYRAINIFGLVITSAQTGPEHRRHKQVVKACFSESVMKSVWENMTNAFEMMLREEGGLDIGGIVTDLKTVMIKLTLVVFCKTGFNLDIPWIIPRTDGKEMPFMEALQTVEKSIVSQLLVPLWILQFFPLASVRRMGQAQVDFKAHLYKMYHKKRAELQCLEEDFKLCDEKMKPPTDIYGALVHSQMNHEAEEKLKDPENKSKIVGLTEKEIIGNMWIFLVAGQVFISMKSFLALYPDWQEKLHQEITSVCGDSMPTYNDINQLPLCLAACYETVRLRDIVMTLPKMTKEDTVLPYTTWDDQGNISHHTHSVKKGSHVIIDSPAASRNPYQWKNPMVWDPTRFLDKENNARFTGFSIGARQCIGKRFAEVEMVAYISRLIKLFKLYPVKEEHESDQYLIERMLWSIEELTTTPSHWSMRLERR